MANIIDGRAMAGRLLDSVANNVCELRARHGLHPALAVVLIGDDPASDIYVRNKLKACKKVGIASREHRLPATTTQRDLMALVDALNRDGDVHGILVQLPLPKHLDAQPVLDAIAPEKDVDGFHPVNVGRLTTAGGGLVPCTPLGCMMLLDSVIPDFRGLDAVVIGKSNIVGKPVALLLLERECTVTVTHIETRNLADIVRKADIVVVAAGHAGLVRGSWVKPGATVIDVGINRVVDASGKTRIVGDTCFGAMDHAAAVTPVPGGVGPMTIACLMANTARAAQMAAMARECEYG
ncbi:MAG: bifunctional 5,10-methylene-tetrahydrofolate dehydrogenase/5,10-methylene-tetrahydrofolate cyclohydrolase [Sphingomonadales bacterium BRH_c42]|nr:MAG: bifunctional 5,10-methylene-tetrahydrofolate dehydrogenase/5,10-methylene-tetrahydrofolate cyclohydrolase [Sphingomonadales bacterium BRH_c42]